MLFCFNYNNKLRFFTHYFYGHFVLSHLLSFLNASTLNQALQTAFWVWVGFIATVMLGSVLWENKPWKLYAINAFHYLVTLLAMGAILTVLA